MIIREKFFGLLELKDYRNERAVTLLITLLTPLLLFIEWVITPDLIKYPYFRIFICIVSLIVFISSYWSKFIQRNFVYITYLLIYIFVSHTVGLTYLNQFSFYYCSLLLSLVIAAGFYFQDKKQLLIFQFSMFVLVLQASFLSVNTNVNIYMFLCFYVILNIIVYMMQSVIFKQNLELKKVARELEVVARSLERTNKSLEQFAYVASHDLQEPLRTVNSYMQLLQRRYGEKLGGDAEEFIGISMNAVKRMQSLIQALLKYSRASSERMEKGEVNLNEVIENVLDNLEISLSENEAKVDITNMPTLKGDKFQLSQLFQNLISNALKYRKDESPVIKINYIENGDHCIISIEDNGIGIPTKYKESVFKIFNRINATNGVDGSGIGLAVCKKIVMNHHGDIWVESEEGKGSTFYFSLALN